MAQALFSGSLHHPQRPLDFARYSPAELYASDLFSDPYVTNPSDMLPGLSYMCHYLLDNARYLEALPLLSLDRKSVV